MSEYSEIIGNIKAGSESAASDLMRSTMNFALFSARGYVTNDDDAQEIAQRSYIKAFRNLSSLNDDNKFLPWFGRIITNTALNYMDEAHNRYDVSMSAMESEDKDGNEIDYDPTDEKIDSQPDVVLDQKVKARIVREILDKLPDKQRVVTMMYFYEGMKITEIADELRISENTVKSRLSAAKESIKGEVLSLEKKEDIKLYSFSPLLFFLWLLHGTKKDLTQATTDTAKNTAKVSKRPANLASDKVTVSTNTEEHEKPQNSESTTGNSNRKLNTCTASDKSVSNANVVANTAKHVAKTKIAVVIGLVAVVATATAFGLFGNSSKESDNNVSAIATASAVPSTDEAVSSSSPTKATAAAIEDQSPKFVYNSANPFGLEIDPNQIPDGNTLTKMTVYDAKYNSKNEYYFFYKDNQIIDTRIYVTWTGNYSGYMCLPYNETDSSCIVPANIEDYGTDNTKAIAYGQQIGRMWDGYLYFFIKQDGSSTQVTESFGDGFDVCGAMYTEFFNSENMLTDAQYAGEDNYKEACGTDLPKAEVVRDENGYITSATLENGDQYQYEYYKNGLLYRKYSSSTQCTYVYEYGTPEMANTTFKNKFPNSGYVDVLYDELDVMQGPSGSSGRFQTPAQDKYEANSGDHLAVFDKVDAEGYTWYQIGAHAWIPSVEGTWTIYHETSEN